MIDPADKQTQAIPLDEQPAKRKRGRPATGKAMTPAEKQRAYRERQKATAGNVTQNNGMKERADEQAKVINELNRRIEALLREQVEIRKKIRELK